jgi:hypothetical protein
LPDGRFLVGAKRVSSLEIIGVGSREQDRGALALIIAEIGAMLAVPSKFREFWRKVAGNMRRIGVAVTGHPVVDNCSGGER